jgi:hypothetical protein
MEALILLLVVKCGDNVVCVVLILFKWDRTDALHLTDQTSKINI